MLMNRASQTLRRLIVTLMLACGVLFAQAAQAKVTITFWSQEFGSNFPHAFFTIDGTPDAGGDPVHISYGFTAKTITPAILMGTVAGRIDATKQSYIDNSNAHFSLPITDAQYTQILSLVDEWGESGDHHYNLNKRNCVHFVAEAMRRAGLTVEEPKTLMKKPRSFSQWIEKLNQTAIKVIELPASDYYASLKALPATSAAIN